jgi:Zn-finger nucleic acid-binding protein
VTVDQCSDCRGLFLDRGGYGEYSHHGKPSKKRKKNFLEELFD